MDGFHSHLHGSIWFSIKKKIMNFFSIKEGEIQTNEPPLHEAWSLAG
jgi:hypothetical protein